MYSRKMISSNKTNCQTAYKDTQHLENDLVAEIYFYSITFISIPVVEVNI